MEETARAVEEVEVCLAEPDAALATALLLPLEWLRETVELLNDKRQIVLYGPPGTGKTFLAQELCKALVESSGGEYSIVQFHPSYAYEDFFEGLRPSLSQDGTGSVSFSVVPGPLRRMAKLATANPLRPYVLIIDEINRANLAKVFGELYFLLEYRGQSVGLQYSEEEFRLPRNLFVIGTMNTADRSIALVDAAMRRRFYFQGLFPGQEPIRSLLSKWLERHQLSQEPARLLAELNNMIGDADFAVGPSYLMTKRVAAPLGLERIWKTAILPLLAEHYFGEGREVDREFGLPALRRALSRQAASSTGSGSDVVIDEPGQSPNPEDE
jgi:5-methylcytosine-specific restriction protein B